MRRKRVSESSELNFLLFTLMSPLFVIVATLYWVMFRIVGTKLSLRRILNEWCQIHGV